MADKIIFKTLMLKGDAGEPTDQQTQAAVNQYMNDHPEAAIDETIINSAVGDWLDDHPEATTTVQDGSLTVDKFSDSLKKNTVKDYVTPEMFGAVGDGITDDTTAFRNAVNTGKLVYCSNEYKITEKIQLKIGVDGYGKIIFTGDGCFTVSVGTTVTNVSFETYGKLLDFVDTDVTSASLPNAHMMVLFKDIKIYCKQGAGTLFDIKSTTYGFFDMVFKSINVTGQCDKAVNIFSDANAAGSWITQIMFIDCMFGTPLHVCTVTKADRVHFERCTSQANNNNLNNLLYDVSNSNMFTIINCFDWDFSYNSTTKLYRFTNCHECVLIGNDRTIQNFDNTLGELLGTFSTLMIGYGYNPTIYNKANILNATLQSTDESFFETPEGYGISLMPIRSTASGASGAIGHRVINSYSSPYGAYSYDFVVNGQGQIKLRVRVPDASNPDSQGINKTKWSDWYTFTPDA